MQDRQERRMDDFEHTMKVFKQDVNNSLHRAHAAESLAQKTKVFVEKFEQLKLSVSDYNV